MFSHETSKNDLIYLSPYSHRVPVRPDLHLRPTTECVFWEGLCRVPEEGDMANNLFHGSKHGRHGEANHEADFSCSLEELCALMELRGPESLTRIQECYGDVNGLCARLRTSPVEGKYVQNLCFCVQFVSKTKGLTASWSSTAP